MGISFYGADCVGKMMFFKKKFLEIKASEKDYVICEICKHLIEKFSSLKCEETDYQRNNQVSILYYCKEHKPKWDIRRTYPIYEMGPEFTGGPGYTGKAVTKYYIKMVQCDENGIILG